MWEEVGFWMESRLAEGVDPPSASAHSEQGNLSKTELNINLEKRKLERRSGPGQPRRNTSNRPTPGRKKGPRNSNDLQVKIKKANRRVYGKWEKGCQEVEEVVYIKAGSLRDGQHKRGGWWHSRGRRLALPRDHTALSESSMLQQL
ncbi:hypothetical protein AOLI_G00178600 [Acnodon oligacanthus]